MIEEDAVQDDPRADNRWTQLVLATHKLSMILELPVAPRTPHPAVADFALRRSLVGV